MKKLISLFGIIALMLTSCGSDDDSSQDSAGVLGNWIIEEFTVNGILVHPEECGHLENITFNNNMTYYLELYGLTSLDGTDCIPIPSSFKNWEVVSDQTINIYFDEINFLPGIYNQNYLYINSIFEPTEDNPEGTEYRFVFKRV
jgi:hypothetical protein